MSKRTTEQLENDFRKLMELSKEVSSMEELSKKAKMSFVEIETSFSNHKEEFETVKERFRNNNLVQYVVDASVMGTAGIREELERIMADENAVIVITSITLRELERLQHAGAGQGSVDARWLLNQALENRDNFKLCLIPELGESPDDSIIDACRMEIKGKIILMTADKSMALKARMYGIEDRYFKQDGVYYKKKGRDFKPSNAAGEKLIGAVRTLNDIKLFGSEGKMYLNAYSATYKKLYIYSNGVEYSSSTKKLEIGDDVFVLKYYEENGYFTFTHFRVIALAKEQNVRIIFTKRFYPSDKIDWIKDVRYRSFIKDFVAEKFA